MLERLDFGPAKLPSEEILLLSIAATHCSKMETAETFLRRFSTPPPTSVVYGFDHGVAAMPEDNIKWSPRPWTLKDFPENLQFRLRKLATNRPLLTDLINGDELYVRRVGVNRFQNGVTGVHNPGTRA